MTVDPVRITGVVELQRALKALGNGAQTELRTVFAESASHIVAGATRRAPKDTGQLIAKGVRSKAEQRGASIVLGGKRVPYGPWLEFGGSVGIGNSVKRPFVKGGRFLFPAIAAGREDLIEAIAAGITDLAQRHGLDATETSA